jgi:gas vesicle protein
MKFSKFTGGLLAGFVLGVLMAPQKGRKTRKQVKHTAEHWKHGLNNLFGKGESELDKLRDTLEKEDLLNPDVRIKLLRLIDENKKTIQAAKRQSLS